MAIPNDGARLVLRLRRAERSVCLCVLSERKIVAAKNQHTKAIHIQLGYMEHKHNDCPMQTFEYTNTNIHVVHTFATHAD